MLKLIKKGDKYWLFEDSQIGLFSPSKFTINLELNEIVIVYENGLKSKRYNVSDCEIYDLGATSPFTTSSGDLFMQKLEELNCPCFQKNENIFNISADWGSISGNLSDQTDLQTALDSKLNKDTTAGVERAYIINADGSQGTKATSEFKDVLEFANLSAFPAIGETGKIYLDLDANKTYRWSGSAYVQIGGGVKSFYVNLPVFIVQPPVIGNWAGLNVNASYPIYQNNTGISDHLLLNPSPVYTILYVPKLSKLKNIKVTSPSVPDGQICIYKADLNGLSNKVLLYQGSLISINSALNDITVTSNITLNVNDSIQLFFKRTTYSSIWGCKLLLTFEEI